MKLKKYIVYGFRVESQMEIKATETDFDIPEITIKFGSVNYPPIVQGQKNEDFIFEKNSIKIRTYDAGFFHIIDANQIIVEPLEGVDHEFVSLYLLALVMAMLMYQRKEFPLHAGTVARSGVCFSLVGHSGAGKSSLSAGFLKCGFKLLSDDVTRLVESPEHLQAVHSFLSQKIWKDAADQLDIVYNVDKKVIPGQDKYYIEDPQLFEQSPQRLTAIIEIVPADVEVPEFVTLSNKDKLNLILDHTFAQEFMGVHNNLGDHLKFCTRVIKKVDIIRLLRPRKLFTVSQQIDLICRRYITPNDVM